MEYGFEKKIKAANYKIDHVLRNNFSLVLIFCINLA